MKKKLIVIGTLVFFIFMNIGVIAQEEKNTNPLGLDKEEYYELKTELILDSVRAMTANGVVNEPMVKWEDEKTPIKRRNAFEMVYIVYMDGNRIINMVSENDDDFLYRISDVEKDSLYDYNLALALQWNAPLLNGKLTSDGRYIADFDSNITYYEAMALISCLFWRGHKFSFSMRQSFSEKYTGEYPYYDLFEDIGLINNENIISYTSLIVKKEDLHKDIPAYEFMHLLYQAMSFPHINGDLHTYPTVPNFKFIDMYKKDYFERISKDDYLNMNKVYIPFELSE